MSMGNAVLIAQARAEGAAIDLLMRSLGNGQGHPRCPACGLRIKSKGHFNMRVTTLKRTWVEVGPRKYEERFVAVDEHRAERLMELARASEQSLQSLVAKFAK